MEYSLILILQLLGIGFHVGQKVLELDKLTPDDSLSDVFKIFWREDKITVLISVVLILPLNEVLYFILLDYGPDSIVLYEYFDLIFFAVSLILGYSGQRLVYGALGKAVSYAEKKVNDKLN
jgi:hypothetical protein